MGAAAHLPVHPLGGEHRHRHRVPVFRARRPPVLDDGDSGPWFLALAFAAGPSLLILLALLVRRFGGFDVGKAPSGLCR